MMLMVKMMVMMIMMMMRPMKDPLQVVGVDYCAAAIKLAKQVKVDLNTKCILAHCNQAVPPMKASHPNVYSQVAEQADLDLDFEV